MHNVISFQSKLDDIEVHQAYLLVCTFAIDQWKYGVFFRILLNIVEVEVLLLLYELGFQYTMFIHCFYQLVNKLWILSHHINNTTIHIFELKPTQHI